MPKVNVLLLFGGKSEEHEVSIMSARNVAQAINKDKYNLTLVGIDKVGSWHELDEKMLADSKFNLLEIKTGKSNEKGSELAKLKAEKKVDVVFPLLHGPNGEDGTVQGLLKLMDIPFVGSSVLGSAINMDKDVAKRLLQHAGIPTAMFEVFRDYEQEKINYETLKRKLGEVMFVKPANMGSSVGISKVNSNLELEKAVEMAFKYDHKILVEEAIVGREIECGVLGNESLTVSLPGEIVPRHDFYDYNAKYIDENGAKLILPADLDEEVVKKAQKLASDSYKILECEGMARVDMFIDSKRNIFINEINTIPGFTNHSMYPKLMELTGISQSELVEKLIELAIKKFEKRRN